jgi:voltage-gated potassium channel
MLQAPSTARRAGQWIAVTTLVVSIAGGAAIWLLDRDEFPSLGSGMWWAVQTVTTVGYGDEVPADGVGRVIATIVMLTGIGFLSVVTASISAAFVESARRRRGRATDELVLERLERIERALEELRRP